MMNKKTILAAMVLLLPACRNNSDRGIVAETPAEYVDMFSFGGLFTSADDFRFSVRITPLSSTRGNFVLTNPPEIAFGTVYFTQSDLMFAVEGGETYGGYEWRWIFDGNDDVLAFDNGITLFVKDFN
jgi:hypothetical protein